VLPEQDKELENHNVTVSAATSNHSIRPRANINVQFPSLPSKERLEQLKRIKGMVDMERVVVVTGFGEVGPYGSARTRWEMEAYGEFSMEGCIELAWMMGLIRYHNDDSRTGWVDAKTGEPIKDDEIKARYEKIILENTVRTARHTRHTRHTAQFAHTWWVIAGHSYH
jgi:3-oxoacyl-ACP reductase-like protein